MLSGGPEQTPLAQQLRDGALQVFRGIAKSSCWIFGLRERERGGRERGGREEERETEKERE